MTLVKFTGHQEMTYLGYAEVGKGVLVCQPGGIYEISPVAFNAPDVPTDGRFTLVSAEEKEEVPEENLPESMTDLFHETLGPEENLPESEPVEE
jgi:hypothetical protein